MIRRLFVRSLLFAALTGGVLMMSVAQAAEATVVLKVEGMNCKFCPITIRKALEKVDGVVSAEVSLEAGEATVVYDDSKTTPTDLANVVTESGYPASVEP